MRMYNLEENRIIEEVQKRKAKRILMQLPEGLKKEALRLSNLIREKTGATVVVSGEPSWGACDLPVEEAKQLRADLIVHFGHAPFHKPDVPIIYIETRYDADSTPLVEKHSSLWSAYKTIGLTASVQHLNQIPQIKQVLEKQGIKVIIPSAKGRAFHEGQVLGCEYTGSKMIEKEVDAFICIGNRFHSLGLALSTEKPTFLIDPVNNVVEDLAKQRDKILWQRSVLIEKAKEAHSFGVIVSLKSGQQNEKVAEFVKQKIESHGREAVIISMKEIMPDELINFAGVDVFVVTACPRVAVEDVAKYEKPILTIKELYVALGEMSWEENLKGGFIVAPYGAQ